MRPLYRVLVLLSAVSVLDAESFTGKTVAITDGDTMARAERVRLWGIDCPESGQPFGTRAEQFTSEMVFGKTVTVNVKDVDRYGRTVAEIMLPDGRNLNQELVRAGLAWWYTQFARRDNKLAVLEQQAREARRGLWADKSPVPPWDWRRAGRAVGQGSR